MDFLLIADPVTVAATQQGMGYGKFLLSRHDFISNHYMSLSDPSADQASTGVLQIAAGAFPVDAVAPPPVKSNSYKTLPRSLLRKRRRTRRGSFSGDFEDGGDGDGFFGEDGGGDRDGPFTGGVGGAGGGRGWNFGGFGGRSWDDSSAYSSGPDPAMDFIYEVICWIALSNCVHFAFKRVLRIVTDGEREKFAMRLPSVC